MAIGLITRRGCTGSAQAYAVISVTYPAGSTCTASKSGEATLTAPDTSGSWLCVVPSGGEWVLSATNGTVTATDTVTVEKGNTYSIELIYALYLFKSGEGALVPFTTVTQSSRSNVTISNSSITLSKSGSGDYGCFVRTTDLLDLSKFSTLIVEISTTAIDVGFGTHGVGIISNAPTSYSDNALNFTAYAYPNSASDWVDKIITVDISGITSGYFAAGTFIYGSITGISLT